jgi:hypothetical protein
MLRINHIDNFGTNLTSGTNAGDTTSPLDSIPSIAAPFWVAFDATSLNGHYERKLITSKTATNVLHSALSYAHTTAEEVRVVNPAEEFDAIYQPPQGYLVNGKISVTDTGSGITVALKTIAGSDPSENDPVFVRIGDPVHMLTSALSVTKADGTNWCNAGSAELATKEIDYFVYLGYNATDGVVIGFSRIPSANQYSDFSVTTTNEKYAAISTITTAASTDYYEVIGRFAATLSAGAGYTWSVPTYTAINLIQRPIYETRWLTWTPAFTGFSSAPTSVTARYKIETNFLHSNVHCAGNGTSNTNGFTMTYPFACSSSVPVFYGHGQGLDNGANPTIPTLIAIGASSSTATLYKDWSAAAWTTSGGKRINSAVMDYEI